MADPFTMLTVAAIAGTGLQGMQAYSQHQYQAEVAQMNAKIAQQNAEAATLRSQIEAQDQDRETAEFIGEQKAVQSSSGVVLGSGSSVAVRRSAHVLGRRDALNILQAGEIERHNYLVDKANYQAQAAGSKMSATSSLLEAGVSMVSMGAGLYKPSMVSSASATMIPKPKPKPYQLYG